MELREIEKSFGEKKVLTGVSFQAEGGKAFGLLGRNMFTRIAMSTVPWYEILISILILVGSVIGVGVISAKIYRVGVLLYGTTPKIGAILKAVWKA